MLQRATTKALSWTRGLQARSDTLGRFIRLASWTLASFALEKGAMIVVVFFLARILGAEDYGRLVLAQGLVNVLQIFIILGAGSMLGRYIPAMRHEGMQRAVEIINLCALVVLGTTSLFIGVALAWGRDVAAGVLDVSASSPIPYWMLAWVVLSALNSLLLTVLLSFERGRALGLTSLIGATFSIIAIPAIAVGYGIEGAVAGLVAIEIVKAAVLAVLYGRLLAAAGVRVLTPARRTDLPLLFSFGVPVFLTAALWAPTIWLAQYIVKTQAPDGLAEVGVFGFANNILGAVILVSSLTNRAALPILSSLQAQGKFDELKKASGLMAVGQIGAATVIGLPLALLAPFIMAQAGPAFAADWPVLVIMIAAGIATAGQTALGNYLLVLDRAYFLFATMCVWSAALLIVVALHSHEGAYALSVGLLLVTILRSALILWGWHAQGA